MFRNLLLLPAALLIVLMAALPAAAEQEQAPASMPEKSDTGGDCGTCHRTSNPSADDLIPENKCRRPRAHENLKEDPEAVPEVVIMDQLSDIYVPVVFPHGLHAQMEAIGDGCGACHHHGEEGKIVSCRTCHEISTAAENLRQPGLKGAYHRQCLACHREWSHDTDCIFCHAKRTASTDAEPKPDPTDITGRLHPNVAVPEKELYPTPEQEEGSMVTFHHKDHVDLFGKRCVDCHQKENCSRCHDSAGPQKHVRQDPHEDCIKCHDTSDNCGKCHKDHEAPPFNHDKSTPFMLEAFHQQVKCLQCHKDGKFAIGKKVCKDCHAPDWFPEDRKAFDHAKTGLTFSEAHLDNECEACHPNGLGETPDCTVCHDDKNYPQDLPGERAADKAEQDPEPVAEPVPAPAPAPAPEPSAEGK